MIQLHYIQLAILKKLLFVEQATLSELRPQEDIENNKLIFHIESLIRHNLVEKINHRYSLTTQGKEYANTIDTDKSQVQKQGKISTIQCCYKIENGEYFFLIYTRKKHPFYGSQGFPSGKVPWGSSAEISSLRELKEETNLEGNPEIFLIEHHIVSNLEEKLVEDKFFYFFRYKNPIGNLQSNEEGLFEWVHENDIYDYLIKPFESKESILRYVKLIKDQTSPLQFNELEYQVDNF
jgi:ADP-ribose pyrophosphatase YjhB (NUDIX family)